jgi:hypothetical protein
VATVARSVSSRASRSFSFVFSPLIWSNIVGVVVGMVAFGGFRSIGMIDLAGIYHRNAKSSIVASFDLTSLAVDAIGGPAYLEPAKERRLRQRAELIRRLLTPSRITQPDAIESGRSARVPLVRRRRSGQSR